MAKHDRETMEPEWHSLERHKIVFWGYRSGCFIRYFGFSHSPDYRVKIR